MRLCEINDLKSYLFCCQSYSCLPVKTTSITLLLSDHSRMSFLKREFLRSLLSLLYQAISFLISIRCAFAFEPSSVIFKFRRKTSIIHCYISLLQNVWIRTQESFIKCLCNRGIWAPFSIFLKALLWTIAIIQRNSVCKLWISLYSLWFSY